MAKKSRGSSGVTESVKILKGRVYFRAQTTSPDERTLFTESLEMLGAKVVQQLDASVTHLMTHEGTLNKTNQTKVDRLVKKGAVIEVLGWDESVQHASVPADLALRLLKATNADREWLTTFFRARRFRSPRVEIVDADLKGLHWEMSQMHDFKLVGVDLSGAVLERAHISEVERSTFDGAMLAKSRIDDVSDSSFKSADLTKTHVRGKCPGCTFEGVNLKEGRIRLEVDPQRPGDAPVFRSVCIEEADINDIEWEGLDFTGASGAKSEWKGVSAPGIRLNGSDLSYCVMEGVSLKGADLTDVNFKDARFSSVDFSGAKLDGADFTGAVMSKCTWDKDVDLAKLKGLATAMEGGPKPSKYLADLDAAFRRAKKIKINVVFEPPAGDPAPINPDYPNYRMELEGGNGTYGFQCYVTYRSPDGRGDSPRTNTLTDAFMRGVLHCAGAAVRFESVRVQTTKSPVTGPEIRNLTIAALADAMGQTPPEEAELKKLTKAYRAELKAKEEAEEAAKGKKAKPKAAVKPAGNSAPRVEPKAKVKDFDTFVAALDVRADAGRMEKAKKMLRGEGFQLFHAADDPSKVLGVIKSQTDKDLVYACRLDDKGGFSCCTQNLRACGGLRGALCKHQLVLLMGLVQAGALDPKKTDAWVKASLDCKPELDQDEMSDVLLKYKGAEAGEIDWRPTETVPEDFYSF